MEFSATFVSLRDLCGKRSAKKDILIQAHGTIWHPPTENCYYPASGFHQRKF